MYLDNNGDWRCYHSYRWLHIGRVPISYAQSEYTAVGDNCIIAFHLLPQLILNHTQQVDPDDNMLYSFINKENNVFFVNCKPQHTDFICSLSLSDSIETVKRILTLSTPTLQKGLAVGYYITQIVWGGMHLLYIWLHTGVFLD